MEPQGDVTDVEAGAALDRVLRCSAVGRSPRLRRLLTYLVEQRLSPGAVDIIQYRIAVEAFGLGDTFDAESRSLVRAHASRLRAALRAYYRGPGAADAVQLQLPGRGYHVAAIRASKAGVPAPLLLVRGFRAHDRSRVSVRISRLLVGRLVDSLARTSQGGVIADAADPAGRRARYVLEGDVERRSGGFVVAVRLTARAERKVAWSGWFPLGPSAEPASLARRLAQIVAGDFGIIDRHSLAAQPAADAAASPEAALLVAKAYELDYSASAYRRASRALAAALRAHPRHADLLAASGLLELVSHGEYFQRARPFPRDALARLALARSLGGDTAMTRYGFAYAACLEGDLVTFGRLARELLDDPDYPPGLASGMIGNLIFMGMESRGDLARLRGVQRGFPLYFKMVHVALALRALAAGRPGEALWEVARSSSPDYWFSLLIQGAALDRLGERDHAARIRGRLLRECPALRRCARSLLRRGVSEAHADLLADWVEGGV